MNEYFKKNQIEEKISFVKMDVEGSEIGALKGMTEILSKNNDLKMLIEFCPQHIESFGTQPEEFIKILIDHGFSFYLVEDNENFYKSVTPNYLLNLPSESCVNLLCKKN